MSVTVTLPPIVHCLSLAERFGNRSARGVWTPINVQQRQLIEEFRDEVIQLVGALSDEEIKGAASRDIEEINAFLRRHNFDIQLDAIAPRSFGVAALFKVVVEWKVPGERDWLCSQGDENDYEAARLCAGYRCFTCAEHPHPVVALQTRTDDTVFLTKAGSDLPDGLDLLHYAHRLHTAEPSGVRFDQVIFPVTEYDECVDISWLLNMQLEFSPQEILSIEQALQQTKFRMDETGAVVESAVVEECCEIEDFAPELKILRIDEPLLLWMTRAGHTLPFFAGHFTEQHWVQRQ